mmetsp:Transcript_58833/g.93048  ORF Transcript_58833/g.93048 Transcript_58833/m.93048 type:complete len:244 (-) Transcript_58833:563-1294(-)
MSIHSLILPKLLRGLCFNLTSGQLCEVFSFTSHLLMRTSSTRFSSFSWKAISAAMSTGESLRQNLSRCLTPPTWSCQRDKSTGFKGLSMMSSSSTFSFFLKANFLLTLRNSLNKRTASFPLTMEPLGSTTFTSFVKILRLNLLRKRFGTYAIKRPSVLLRFCFRAFFKCDRNSAFAASSSFCFTKRFSARDLAFCTSTFAFDSFFFNAVNVCSSSRSLFRASFSIFNFSNGKSRSLRSSKLTG